MFPPNLPPSLQRLGLPRYLLEPPSREESSTEVEEWGEEEEEEEEVRNFMMGVKGEEATCECKPQLASLEVEVEEVRRREEEWRGLVQRLSMDNLGLVGAELGTRSRVEEARRGQEGTRRGQEGARMGQASCVQRGF